MKVFGSVIGCIILLYLLYSSAAFVVFGIRHPKANRWTYYTYHFEVVTFATVEALR